MLITVTSMKGSVGVTTAAVVLAAVWPGPLAPVVLEADCSGGDLGPWWWLPDSSGLVALGTQGRSTTSAPPAPGTAMTAATGGSMRVADFATPLPCGVDAVLAPAGRRAATAAVGLLAAADPARWMGERPVITDVGRWEPTAPSAALVRRSDVLLVVSKGDEGSLLRLAAADPPTSRTRLVLTGGSTYSPAEIGAHTGWQVAAQLPWDAHAAGVVGGQRTARAGWTRRGLPAATRALALALAEVPAGSAGSEPRGTRPAAERPTGHPAAAHQPAPTEPGAAQPQRTPVRQTIDGRRR